MYGVFVGDSSTADSYVMNLLFTGDSNSWDWNIGDTLVQLIALHMDVDYNR